MKSVLIIISVIAAVLCGCSQRGCEDAREFPIVSWGGVPADKADTLFALAKECGFNTHLGLYRAPESVLVALDAAERAGVGMIVGHPYMKDSTEMVVMSLKNHPALVAYHLKDEPELSDFSWLSDLHGKVLSLDSEHPCYINLYPNWAWGHEQYMENIEAFATQFDLPFYSFDHYPVIEVEGKLQIRPEWYRNLEEFSRMTSSRNKPFWGFVLITSHHLGDPFPPVFYPEPTIGQIRLQAFGNLLYGAQGLQYFTFAGVVDASTFEKKPLFDMVRQVNLEVQTYAPIFLGCDVRGVWHMGDVIPDHTKKLGILPHESILDISFAGEGAVVSLLENNGSSYLVIQNKDCVNSALVRIDFRSSVKRITLNGEMNYDGTHVPLSPGDISIFRL